MVVGLHARVVHRQLQSDQEELKLAGRHSWTGGTDVLQSDQEELKCLLLHLLVALDQRFNRTRRN